MTNIYKISGVLFITQGSQNPSSYWGAVGNYQFSDDNTKVQVNIGQRNYFIAITDLQVNGQTPANADEAKVLLNAVFPDTNSGSGGTVSIPSTSYADNATALAALGAGQLYKSTTLINDSPIILLTV